ncbi:7391_t:CDS:2 [Funneliformis mosseae]|uniref:7391_t:CDS:1 n=1 Tax=Funneliformis mosseae TaxID=27381 RepID=A0A9N8VQ54_FUNMO|nr:7391_t:CDS:2 [Funneliformis mosseae]
MLSVATSSLSALPSTIRDSFSRNTSDSEQSKEGTTDPPQNTFRDKIDLGNTKLDEASVNSSLPTPPLSFSTPKEEKQPKIAVDAEPSTTWQENLAGTAEPTTDVDNTPVVFKPSLTLSDSGSSLKIEHFVKPDDDDFISTPIAGDISSQIPPTQNTVNDQSDSNNNDSRKSFRLTSKPNSKLKKKNRQGASESIIDDSTLAESPPVGGYAPAAPRKNAEFHSLFRSVPEDDYLINDYGCALQKEILVQGRLYVSAKHVCFYANIFGWVTILVIAFSDILSIEKKMTAFVIPNAVLISTLHAKHFFTSFLSRDPAFELMYTMWKQTHPALALTESENSTSRKDSDASETSENNNSITSDDEVKSISSQGVILKNFALPKLTLDPMRLMRGPTSSSDDDNTLNQEKLDSDIQSLPLSLQSRVFDNSSVAKEQRKRRSRSKSDVGLQLPDTNGSDSKHSEKIRSSSRNQSRHTASNTVKRRRPTQCACLKKGQHYDNVSLDTKLNGSVEKIFNLLFVNDLVKNYIREEDKCTDIEFEEWKIEDNIWTRSQSYTKPLNNPIGPKSTKCFIKDECSHFDDYITNVSTATTPDVPSGNNFCVKTRTCIMCAGTNESRIIVTCAIEWSKSSWLKGAIEKACIEGQRTHWQNISQVARKYIAAHLSDFIDQLGTTVQDDEAIDSEVASEKATPLKRTHTHIGHRLDGLDSSQYRFGYSGRSGDFLYEPRKRHGNMPLFDERIENEDDTLWNWLRERSNMYEEIDRKESSFYTSKSEPISSKVHSTSPRDSSSSSQPRPISSQGLYEQMENLRQLIQTAEEHAKKLVDVAEFESAHYYKDSKDKRNGGNIMK